MTAHSDYCVLQNLPLPNGNHHKKRNEPNLLFIFYNKWRYGGGHEGRKGCSCCDDGDWGILGGLSDRSRNNNWPFGHCGQSLFAIYQAVMMMRNIKINSANNFEITSETFEILHLRKNIIFKKKKNSSYLSI